MEDLTKTQIVLLCLLVSFVTSIGTGVITFSLLSDVPQTVTQTINRVVERTIEKVVPSATNDKNTGKEVTTVVVKEEDLVIDAISKSTKSIVRIKSGDEHVFYGLGIVVSKEGLIVADAKGFYPTNSYEAFMSDGKSYPLTPVELKEKSDLAFFKIKKASDDKTEFSSAVFGNSDTLQLGQSVIAIGGMEQTFVATGRVSGLKRVAVSGVVPDHLDVVQTDINLKDTVFGGPLVNLSGQIVGINIASTFNLQGASFTPINLVQVLISAVETK